GPAPTSTAQGGRLARLTWVTVTPTRHLPPRVTATRIREAARGAPRLWRTVLVADSRRRGLGRSQGHSAAVPQTRRVSHERGGDGGRAGAEAVSRRDGERRAVRRGARAGARLGVLLLARRGAE